MPGLPSPSRTGAFITADTARLRAGGGHSPLTALKASAQDPQQTLPTLPLPFTPAQH